MPFGAISQQFLQESEAVAAHPVQLDVVERMDAPLLARFQLTRGGIPFHRGTDHPNPVSLPSSGGSGT